MYLVRCRVVQMHTAAADRYLGLAGQVVGVCLVIPSSLASRFGPMPSGLSSSTSSAHVYSIRARCSIRHGLDRVPVAGVETDASVGDHENVRGPDYYH
jgi:hypothetical protein